MYTDYYKKYFSRGVIFTIDIEKTLYNMQRQINNIIKTVSKDKQYTGYDIEAGRVNTAKAQKSADDANELSRDNSHNIEEVSDGLMETFEETVRNATSVEELQDAIIELYEMIIEKEV